MRYFPIFVDFDRSHTVLVFGGGEDAARKVRLLLKTDVSIKLVAAELNNELSRLANDGSLDWIAAAFTDAQMDSGPNAVFCADGEATNIQVSEAAQLRNIPVNVVDRADLSTFIIPAIVDRDPLVVAIGTEGTGPVLAQGIRARIEAMLPPAVGGLLSRAAALRATVANSIRPGAGRRMFWTSYFFGAPRDAYLDGDEDRFAQSVEQQLSTPNEDSIGHVALLDVCKDPELLTLKAHRLLQEADVIVHDTAVTAGILEFARRDASRQNIDATVWSCGPFEHNRTAACLLNEAEAGRRVVRLYDASASALDSELAALIELNTSSIAIDHIRSVPDERTWSPLIEGQTVDGITPWRLAS